MTRYVALGSSFASGPGIGPILEPACGRSGNNYGHLLAARLGFDLIDATCGGATVENVVSAPQELMTGGRVPPQLDALVADADLVTVTVGGNDVEYLATLLRCSYRAAPETAPPGAAEFFGTDVDLTAVHAALDVLPARQAAMVDAIRDRAPRARVVLVDYLTVLPSDAAEFDQALVPMTGPDLRECREVAARLAAATGTAARDADADLVHAFEISRDHAAGTSDPWVSGWEFGDVLAGGLVPYHPNAAGMRVVADLLTERLRGTL